MGQMPPDADDEAVAWAVRTGDPAFADWEGFTAWLERDAGHAARYDAIMAAIADAADLVPPAQHVAVPCPSPSTRRWWIGSAVAAAVAVTVGIELWPAAADPYAVETAPGTQRRIALGDGSTVTLAGGTRLMLDRADRRIAIVEHGEALFEVRHDADHPFRVRVGGAEMVDVGTTFDVKHDGGVTRVAVSEGAVVFDPDGLAMRLDPGQGLVANRDTASRITIDPGTIAPWREGMLSYDGVPFAEVAADLTRAMGIRVTAEPAIAVRTFHGTLRPAELRRDPATLGLLMGVTVRQTPQGWVLSPQ